MREIAHLEKYTRGSTGSLFAHYSRKKDKKGNHRKYGNQDIDLKRTHLNYNLAPIKDIDQVAILRKRLEEVRVFKRSDVNVMCDWVVTLPESIEQLQDQDKFFKETYKFLEKEYGRENVISSYVHLDETTPHMHFAFVPVVIDKKKGDLKVSAKELITRTHLKKFHKNLERNLEKAFGFKVGVLNDATKEGNKSVKKLKNETIEKLEKEINTLENDLNALKQKTNDYLGVHSSIEQKDRTSPKKTFLNRNKVIVPSEEYENMKIEFNSLVLLKRKVKDQEEEIQRERERNSQLDEKNWKLENKVDDLRKTIDQYHSQIEIEDKEVNVFQENKKLLEQIRLEKMKNGQIQEKILLLEKEKMEQKKINLDLVTKNKELTEEIKDKDYKVKLRDDFVKDFNLESQFKSHSDRENYYYQDYWER